MRAFRLVPVLLTAALVLGACGPAKVNLRSMSLQFDRYKDAAPDAQARYDAKRLQLAEILKQTRTPDAQAYADLGAQLERMAGAVRALRDDDERFHAFKPRFDAYAADKNIVTEEDPAEWARYQSVMAEYNAIRGDIYRQNSALASAEAGWTNILNLNGIRRASTKDLRAEVLAARDEVTAGVNEMEEETSAGWRALDFARKAGADPAVLAEKKEALKGMDALLPGAKLLRAAVDLAGQHSSRVLRGERILWTGPGMSEQEGRLVKDVREAVGQYREGRQSWDKLNAKFEAAAKPTPVPSPAASPVPASTPRPQG